ncbi:hypothetical protein [Psychrilyobacter atlanticus]|uniref:hypothetical protein n=1 Tax=Psychrilyobacter atlanticus TaxID=271091 RepID=UPI00040E72B0|nr:hypothetical protein [Psychrilyobacter atlanticus]
METKFDIIKEFLIDCYSTLKEVCFFYVIFIILGDNKIGIDILKTFIIVMIVQRAYDYIPFKRYKNYLIRVAARCLIEIPLIGVLVAIFFNIREIPVLTYIMKRVVIIYIIMLVINYLTYKNYQKSLKSRGENRGC